MNGGLKEGEALILYDWSQSMSLPHGHEETSTMWYGSSRKELALFGCIVAQRKTGSANSFCNILLLLPEVLDHTSYVSPALLMQVTLSIHVS